MPDWNTRLEVKVAGKTVTPIDNFTPTFNTPHTVIHSLEGDNVGFVRQPFTFTFTMTVRAIGTVVAELADMALKGTEFDVAVAEKRGTDWAFNSIKFSRCVITSTNPSNVVIDGAPTASFNCAALVTNIEKGT
ncbi:MAG TPA: hypothetical protein VEL31_07735 [Ktedonobacteraceae bacterium]|nr:hypothetical protein [Ktedonobacteraceae bacterium]